jgi:hypothetical protein
MQHTKYTNAILAHKKNGGIHSIRQLKSVQTMLTTHDLKKAVMYQFILSGSTKAEYQATIKALVRHIRTKCKAEYLGAYEVGDEKGGLHCHCYVIIETHHHYPADLLDVSEGQWIARRIKRTGMSIKIEPPKGRMHGGAMFAKMDTPAKLADCIAWCSYHVKARSKNAGQDRETYFASEFASNTGKREAKRQRYRDALTKSSRPAATEASPFPLVGSPTGRAEQTTNERESSMHLLTPAVFRYVGGLYETAVDADLDLDALRLYLLSHGIKRTPAQVVHELDETYGFHQYASSHPAPPRPNVVEMDKMIDRMSQQALRATQSQMLANFSQL